MIDYAELKPFGFIPGEYEMVCQGCNQKWALMAATATHCKRCARNALTASKIVNAVAESLEKSSPAAEGFHE
jgi:predicted amidophosphoribosyltransferase